MSRSDSREMVALWLDKESHSSESTRRNSLGHASIYRLLVHSYFCQRSFHSSAALSTPMAAACP